MLAPVRPCRAGTEDPEAHGRPRVSPCWSVNSRRVVTKWPVPRPVCFSGETDSMTEDTLSRSPRTRGRAYSCSQLVATTDVKPASSSTREELSWPEGRPDASARRLSSAPPRLRAVAPHDPGLEHGGRGDHAGEAVGPGRLVVGVDGVLVAHGVDPVPDHGLVDLVAGLRWAVRWACPRRPAGGPGTRRRRRRLRSPAGHRLTALTGPPGSCPGRPWPRSRAGSR